MKINLQKNKTIMPKTVKIYKAITINRKMIQILQTNWYQIRVNMMLILATID